MDRKKYWNKEYCEYWKQRTEEAELSGVSNVIKGDTKTADRFTYYSLIKGLSIGAEDIVLEIGCGFGRGLERLLTQSKNVYGMDISEAMVRAAKNDYGDETNGLIVAEAEKPPFKNESFTKIVCFAVFDALYQKEALVEINEKLKHGGKVLITGKNDNYKDDDEKALVAEIRAREKSHPNYFTDVANLLANLDAFGFKLLKAYYYEKRGDFSRNRYMIAGNGAGEFYEYALFLQKIGVANKTECAGIIVSNGVSKTFLRAKSHDK
ncbi:MAG: class I SAM-dependent methyltransferase [Candidatus Omnitrophota bacterium]|nr:class I SAM-dependent methyltransferase [Candidatus Omnitrophota bacterium]